MDAGAVAFEYNCEQPYCDVVGGRTCSCNNEKIITAMLGRIWGNWCFAAFQGGIAFWHLHAGLSLGPNAIPALPLHRESRRE